MRQYRIQRRKHILERSRCFHKGRLVRLQERMVWEWVGDVQRSLVQVITDALFRILGSLHRNTQNIHCLVLVTLSACRHVRGENTLALCGGFVVELCRFRDRVCDTTVCISIWLGQRRNQSRVESRQPSVLVQRDQLGFHIISSVSRLGRHRMNPREGTTEVGLTKAIIVGGGKNEKVVQVLEPVDLLPHLVALEPRDLSQRHHLLVCICRLFGCCVEPNRLGTLNCLVKFNVLQDLKLIGFKGEEFHYTDPRTFSHRADASLIHLAITSSGAVVVVWKRIASFGMRGCPTSADTNSVVFAR